MEYLIWSEQNWTEVSYSNLLFWLFWFLVVLFFVFGAHEASCFVISCKQVIVSGEWKVFALNLWASHRVQLTSRLRDDHFPSIIAILSPDCITLTLCESVKINHKLRCMLYRLDCLIYVQLARGRKTKNKIEQSATSDSHKILQSFCMPTEGLRMSGSVSEGLYINSRTLLPLVTAMRAWNIHIQRVKTTIGFFKPETNFAFLF